MTNVAILGQQWGDEGKGKLVHLLAPRFGVVARYQGGRNAGHTVYIYGKPVVNHLVPSGILAQCCYNAILGDVILDPVGLKDEIESLRKMGYKVDSENLGISGLAHITLDFHKKYERLMEKRKGGGAIGTTMRGIGTTATGKAAREGLRFSEFVNPESFESYLESLPRSYRNFWEWLVTRFKRSGNIIARDVNITKYLEMYMGAQEFLAPFLVNESELIQQYGDKNWLFEGAQGCLLDLSKGTYPYVTSTNPANPPPAIDSYEGVYKAYVTRVGAGPFPTRMEPETEEPIRKKGNEFGATTGRPRNCGWFDAVAGIYARRLSRLNKMHIMKLDVLTGIPEIPVCIKYKYKGSYLGAFPEDRFVLEKVEPVYEIRKGWTKDIKNATERSDLQTETEDYVKYLEDLLECKANLISIGPNPEQTLHFND